MAESRSLFFVDELTEPSSGGSRLLHCWNWGVVAGRAESLVSCAVRLRSAVPMIGCARSFSSSRKCAPSNESFRGRNGLLVYWKRPSLGSHCLKALLMRLRMVAKRAAPFSRTRTFAIWSPKTSSN